MSFLSSLLDRGYSRRDIAVLVDTNQLGKDVIASLVDYNSSLEQGAKKIEFISEESLLVSFVVPMFAFGRRLRFCFDFTSGR